MRAHEALFRIVGTLIFSSVLVLPHVVQAEEFDLEVENTAALADSEGAIAAAEEARIRAEDEKIRSEQEKKMAEKESARARKLEAQAKDQIVRHQKQEAIFRVEREKAEARVKVAREKIQKTESEMQARDVELNALREVVEKLVAERDQLESHLEQAHEKLQKQQVQLEQERKRKAATEQASLRLRNKIIETEKRVADMRRPASGAAVSRKGEGWVKLKKNCGLKSEAKPTASEIESIKAGDRLYGRRAGQEWIQVEGKSGQLGFLSMACLK